MDIGQEKRKVKDEIKKKFKTFLWFFLMDMITVFGGSCLFIYIEHCYDVGPQTKTSIETKYEALCQQLKSANLTTSQYMNNETAVAIQNLCIDAPVKFVEVNCVYNMKNIFKWTRFCMSVGFTTGYGRVVPFSDTGKVITICYALSFIPMMAATLVYCSKFCVGIVKFEILFIEERVLGRQQISHFNRKIVVFQTLILLLLLNVFAVRTKGDLVDSNNNPTNSYIDAYYYAVITMTTIGFGDYDYGQSFFDKYEGSVKQSIFSHLYSILYLLLIANGASFINALTSLQTSQRLCKKSIKILRGKSTVKSVDNPTFNQDKKIDPNKKRVK